MTDASTFVIHRGDLPSLLLVMMQPDPTNCVVWHPRVSGQGGEHARECAEAVAEIRNVARFIASDFTLPQPCCSTRNGTKGAADDAAQREANDAVQAKLLIEASILARQVGCSRILSPRIVGPDHRQVARALEQALVAVDLVVGHATHSSNNTNGNGRITNLQSIAIDLPLVDRTDEELVELAVDLGAPLACFSPCERDADRPCETCHDCRRWQQAFATARVPWPFDLVTSA